MQIKMLYVNPCENTLDYYGVCFGKAFRQLIAFTIVANFSAH